MDIKRILKEAGEITKKTIKTSRSIAASTVASYGDLYAGVTETLAEGARTVANGVASVIESDPNRKSMYRVKTQIGAVQVINSILGTVDVITDNILGPGASAKASTSKVEKLLKNTAEKISK